MFENIENIKIVYANETTIVKKKKIKDRKNHLLSFRIEGGGCFDFGDKVIESVKGETVFVPAGSSYEFTPSDDGKCVSMRIAFLAEMDNAVPRTYSLEGFSDMGKLVYEMPKLWRKAEPASRHRCLSILHSLIAFLIEEEQKSYEGKTKYKIIKPAIEYLDEHIFDSFLDVEKLCSLCKISPPYFRRIFRANFGMSPWKYIEEKRLSYALAIVENGDYNSISEVAKRVGYNDALYFGQTFKKRFGISPSYIRTQKN